MAGFMELHMRRIVLCLVLGVYGSACTCGAIPRERYWDEALAAICDYYTKCGATTTSAGCQDFFSSSLGSASLAAFFDRYLADGKVQYDGVAARRCFDQYRAASCSGDGWNTTAISDCQNVFTGTVAVGGACDFGSQCVPEAYCTASLTGQCPGECKARVAAGGTVTSGDQCVANTYSKNGVCTAFAPEGGACEVGTFIGCNAGLKCVAGVCKRDVIEVGATCQSSSECGLFYACVNGACAELHGEGASCDGAARCKLDLRCATEGTAKVCRALLAEGAACTAGDCKPPLTCSMAGSQQGTCRQPPAVNQSCDGFSCAVGLYCEGATKLCKTQITAGGACKVEDLSPCADFGSCINGKCSAVLPSCG